MDKSIHSENLPTNSDIALVLNKIADLLEITEENPYKIRAYRVGAQNVKYRDEKIANLVKAGDRLKLKKMPGIGDAIASVITEYVQNGNSSLLLKLQNEVSPELVFTQIPGISNTLAKRIIDTLHTKTLEELEVAAYNGDIRRVGGIGAKRLKAIKSGLNSLLKSRSQIRDTKQINPPESKIEIQSEHPDIKLLLDIDKEYLDNVKEDKLKKIAPKRFNPEGKAWLPVMYVKRGGWDFSALFSNTKAAHDAGKTNDWVVVYYKHDGYENEVTVVTETKGDLEGKRVVRGREEECKIYYRENSN